jgi:hypothetical protein
MRTCDSMTAPSWGLDRKPFSWLSFLLRSVCFERTACFFSERAQRLLAFEA